MPRAQPGGAMYDGFGHYVFLADASETLVLQGFKGFTIIFLGRPFLHSQNCLFSNGHLRVWGNHAAALFLLGTRSGMLGNTTFPNGFTWFCSIFILPDDSSWQARSGIVGFTRFPKVFWKPFSAWNGKMYRNIRNSKGFCTLSRMLVFDLKFLFLCYPLSDVSKPHY